jgi:hypothetical protein
MREATLPPTMPWAEHALLALARSDRLRVMPLPPGSSLRRGAGAARAAGEPR